jgi:hypothetical protein
MEKLPTFETINEDSIICTLYNGESEGKIRLLGDGMYICAAYFPLTDIEIFFTIDGIPNYKTYTEENLRTAFLKDDIEKLLYSDYDFSPVRKEQLLTYNEINIMVNSNILLLEVRTPLGMWYNAGMAPIIYIKNLIINKEFHLFRKVM